MKEVIKACPCVIRTHLGHPQILAFRHPLAGCQIPKGTVENNELVPQAVLRELEEETGLNDVKIISLIGYIHNYVGAGSDESGPLEKHIWYLYHLELTSESKAKWSHQAIGSPEENGLTFECYWQNLYEDYIDFHPIFIEVMKKVKQYL